MKTLDENDPRLTAYALDELDAGEREAVEAHLATNATARAAVEEIRETAALLREGFGNEPALALGKRRADAVLGNGGGDGAPEHRIARPAAFSRVSRFLGIAAVAACLGVVSVVGLRQYLDEAARPRPVAAESNAHRPESSGDRTRTDVDVASGAVASLSDEAGLPAEGSLEPEAEPEFLAMDEVAAPEDAAALPGIVEPSPEVGEAADPAPLDALVPPVPAARALAAEGKEETPDAARSRRALAEAPAPMRKQEAAGTRGGLPDMPDMPMVDAESSEAIGGVETLSDGFGDGFGGGGLGGDGFGGAPGVGGAPRAVESSAPRPKRGASRAASPPASAVPAPSPVEERVQETDAAAPKVGRGNDRPPAAMRAAAAGERYAPLVDNPFVSTWDENVSTFSIDVDNAAYSNVRRFVTRNHQLPPKDAVRIEEMINYFDYDYPQPADGRPFSVNLEVASCPWEKDARLVRIGLQGLAMHPDKRPPSNLVFLIDVSGSMAADDKLPLLQSAMMALVDALNEDDSIAIVVYAGSSGLVLDATSGDLKGKIRDALAALQSGGSTNGGQGIALAYETAKAHFIEGGVNRVILATDGDFNVGLTDHDALVGMVESRAKEDNIFLTVLGFGEGNLNDHLMEQIADKGNGNYFYIDNGKEGRRVLVDRLSATLVTIAKDVKVQVDFNPAKVARYRLIGYANRMLENRDFRDDAKDAGEIGAGHTVTALYQVLPAGTETALAEAKKRERADAEESKYLRPDAAAGAETARGNVLVPSEEMLTVRLRYKQPDSDEAEEFEIGITDPGSRWEEAGGDFRFASAVAGYGMLLRDSEFKGTLNYDLLLELADEGKGSDPHGLRAEFIDIVKASKALAGDRE